MSLSQAYETLKKEAGDDIKSAKVTARISQLATKSLALLAKMQRWPITSNIEGKDYFVFKKGAKLSRPIRNDLFDPHAANEHLSCFENHDFDQISTGAVAKLLYTVAMSYCAAIDILKTGDKKTPSIFFECFAANIFARELGVTPTNSIAVVNLEKATSLPTDFLFDPGPGKSRIHLPVKTSTRERAVQAWAHQRVLDGIFGVERFRGVMVCLSETNYQSKNNSVVEVCTPEQWAVYQMFIARLHRIYYLDVPRRYEGLKQGYPYIQVKHLAEFFKEKNKVIAPLDQ